MFKQLKYIIILLFVVYSFGPLPVYCAEGVFLPKPGVMVHLSPAMNAPAFKGIKVYPNDPLKLDFILDQPANSTSSTGGNRSEKNEEANKLVKYFLTALTIPENDLWVNLSPYEKDRIISDKLGQTDLGRDMLAQDYLLKQITASLMHPDGEVGKKFWEKIYQEASEKFGTTNVPVNTINKVWIVPDKAEVFDNSKGTAYITKATLKVMLEEDYLAISRQPGDIDSLGAFQRQLSQCPQAGCQASNVMNAKATQGVTGSRHHFSQKDWQSQIIREIIIPELTTEVNEGKNFAPLRQVYHAIILAAWYKRTIKTNIISAQYVDQHKIQGINIQAQTDAIYQQYLTAYKKGVSNMIREEVDSATHQRITRKYFTGGDSFTERDINAALHVHSQEPVGIGSRQNLIEVRLNTSSDLAMNAVATSDDGLMPEAVIASLKQPGHEPKRILITLKRFDEYPWGDAIIIFTTLVRSIIKTWPMSIQHIDVITDYPEIFESLKSDRLRINPSDFKGEYDLVFKGDKVKGLYHDSVDQEIIRNRNVINMKSICAAAISWRNRLPFNQGIEYKLREIGLTIDSEGKEVIVASTNNKVVFLNTLAETNIGFSDSMEFWWVDWAVKLITSGYSIVLNAGEYRPPSLFSLDGEDIQGPKYPRNIKRMFNSIVVRTKDYPGRIRVESFKSTKDVTDFIIKEADNVVTIDTGIFWAANLLARKPTVVVTTKNSFIPNQTTSQDGYVAINYDDITSDMADNIVEVLRSLDRMGSRAEEMVRDSAVSLQADKSPEGGVDFRGVNKGVVVNRLSGSEPIALSSAGIVIKQGLNFTILNSSTVNLQDWLLN